MTDVALVALGSNLGDRAAHLAFARDRIRSLPSTRILGETDTEETAPLGGMEQPAYLNQMLAIETALPPRDLLLRLQEIERARGRRPGVRWVSRTLDLDIVIYDEVQSRDPDLVLPHPGLAGRDFWQRQVAALRQLLSARA
jgi:2-amino-4-hydroxy-6-hydroxymethyldihydropteridine diphosphokinase